MDQFPWATTLLCAASSWPCFTGELIDSCSCTLWLVWTCAVLLLCKYFPLLICNSEFPQRKKIKKGCLWVDSRAWSRNNPPVCLSVGFLPPLFESAQCSLLGLELTSFCLLHSSLGSFLFVHELFLARVPVWQPWAVCWVPLTWPLHVSSSEVWKFSINGSDECWALASRVLIQSLHRRWVVLMVLIPHFKYEKTGIHWGIERSEWLSKGTQLMSQPDPSVP